jgi:spore germination protein
MHLRIRNVVYSLTLLAMLLLMGHGGGLSQAADAPVVPMASGIRWGFYVTYSANSWASLQANVKNLNHVSPWLYYLNKEGKVTGKDDARVSSLLREVKVRNLPMIKNDATYNDFSEVMTNTNKMLAIVDQLDNIVTENHYDGITIDFEGLNPFDKQPLSNFMKLLYDRLHARGKLVAIAVAVKTREITTGWAAAYDYPALAASADYMLLMAYDYHWSTSDPGPVAPIGKLRDTAAYALTKIPAKKLIWGVGVYGYDWPLALTGELDGKAESRTFLEANALVTSPGAESGYDTEAEAPWVRYTRDGKPRELWYEDRRSFEAKMDFVEDKKLAGFGIWRLGQEDPQIWSVVSARATAACRPVKAFTSTATKVFFRQTAHSLGGVFLRYWNAHGGLPVYGYPLTEEFSETSPTDGKQYKVQYFERNRFEYHPENKPPNDVQLGLLGVQTTRGRVFPSAENLVPGPDTVYFPQVQHTLEGTFLKYWQEHGGLAQFGFPISESMIEKSAVDGRTYLVQYMERARFELHPEYAGTPSEVLLGLLGRDILPCR